ncbi:hypothetical protein [Streptomyces sp. NPDC056144]|uniref:hypothetical protein n=1 Tax=unclassified Streptomyces TaxID=2593676 RepID=UPI0035D6F821
MFVFVCAGCEARLTVPLSPVMLPVHAHQNYGNGVQLPVLMEPGTFAVEPEPSGPPWRKRDGAPGAVVIAPGDATGTVLIQGRRAGGYCCGLDGADGPNTACGACGLPVAIRIDDCSLWQATWLQPHAVRRVPATDGGADTAPLSWPELMAEGKTTPPFEPIAAWRSRMAAGRWSNYAWSWSPRWEAAAGQALAHLLAASDGHPVTVPDGMAGQLFRRALDTLLPPGRPVRRAALAGPGLPAPGRDTSILLVPSHPQTGDTWTPADAAPYLVPLPFGVWLCLAFPQPDSPVPASGAVPAGALRDDYDPQPPHPRHLFRADPDIFRDTLVRLPAVRSPWLREILDDLPDHIRTGRLF